LNIQAKLEENFGRVASFTICAAMLAIFIGLINFFFPQSIPYGFLDAWQSHDTLWAAVLFSWPIFAWVTSFTVLVAFFTRNSERENLFAEEYLKDGIVKSAIAGFFEEIIFRWLLFYSAIATVQFFNGIFFAWWLMHFGIGEWLYNTIIGHVVNFFTFGTMHDILFHPLGWFIGSAVVVSNKNFREGHKYLGLIGYVNSWFIGMFLFYVMFHFGLLAAIVIHFIYDMIIFAISYVDRVMERMQSKK